MGAAMSLTLTSDDIRRLGALQETLLAPLEYQDLDQWCLAVLRCAERLYQTDRSIFFLPVDGAIHNISENVAQLYRVAFERGIVASPPGAFRYADPLTDRIHAGRRRQGLEVWDLVSLGHSLGISIEKSPVYYEVVGPAEITYGPVMSVGLPVGEAYLGTCHADPQQARFRASDELILAGLVLPSFKAATRLLSRLQGHRRSLLESLEAVGEPLALYDTTGRLCHETGRVNITIGDDPERGVLRDAMQRLAVSLVQLVHAPHPGAIPRGSREVRTRQARYEIAGSFVGKGALGWDELILVRLERLTPRLPQPTQLVARFGLTGREAQVATLLAQGLTNTAVADRLRVSRHTVRHHAEAVFRKLGVHSRKALALTLLAGTDSGKVRLG